jgi:hypothetical protein
MSIYLHFFKLFSRSCASSLIDAIGCAFASRARSKASSIASLSLTAREGCAPNKKREESSKQAGSSVSVNVKVLATKFKGPVAASAAQCTQCADADRVKQRDEESEQKSAVRNRFAKPLAATDCRPGTTKAQY